MRALLPFLRLFKFAKLPLFLGLVLMIYGSSLQYWLADHIGLVFSRNGNCGSWHVI